MQIDSVTAVAKEEIPLLNIHNKEVLPELHLIMHRKQLLIQGMLQGNSFKGKVQIFFEAEDIMYRVESIIWAIADDYVLLKSSVYLPIRCIHEVIVA